MSQAPRTKAILDLLAAHKELSAIELRECQQTVAAAALWSTVAVVGSVVGWLALNAAVVVAFGRDPWKALCILGASNLLAATFAALRARSLARRPFFALTRREAARDAQNLLELVS